MARTTFSLRTRGEVNQRAGLKWFGAGPVQFSGSCASIPLTPNSVVLDKSSQTPKRNNPDGRGTRSLDQVDLIDCAVDIMPARALLQ
jgi:hypothetical protein